MTPRSRPRLEKVRWKTRRSPKAVHDAKSAMHALVRAGHHRCAGVQHDPCCTPTCSIRRTRLQASRGGAAHASISSWPDRLAEAADITLRLTDEAARAKSRPRADRSSTRRSTCRWSPVLRPHGRRRHQDRLRRAGRDVARGWTRDCAAKAREIYEKAGVEFNVNSPKQLGDVLFNKLNLPKPIKYGKGKVMSTAVDVLEGLAEEHDVPKLVLEYRQLSKLKSTYVDALPALLNSGTARLHTTFNMAGSATGRLSSVNPNLQNIPIRTELGREIRAAFIAEPGNVLLTADYSQIELRLLAHFSEDPLLVEAYRTGEDIHTLTASQVFGVPPLMSRRRASPPRQGRQLRHRLRAVGVRAVAADRHRHQRGQAFHRRLLREVQRRARLHRPHARRSPPRDESCDPLRPRASHSRHPQQELQPARIRRAHGGQHSAARHGGRLDQDGDDPHRLRNCASAS